MLRRATHADVDEITRIYNQALKPGIFATSQIAPDTPGERTAWLSEHQDPYPAFVYQSENGAVIGWCSLNKFSVRPEYTDVAATSCYIDENCRGKGLGRKMHAYLIEVASNFGLRLLVSRALERNIASLKSTSSLGFRRVAVLHEAARIRGEWHNDVWLWKQLR
ncbi:N-acetyltransferase family protein [Bradyrhizobium sp. B117]|uniref:GNAT family N-acetyltransferase n=1 Tax=Bradyrhizobium sp. B117 TaxID=3140246 RepID=UPI003182BC7B